jgi:hypothetical protein
MRSTLLPLRETLPHLRRVMSKRWEAAVRATSVSPEELGRLVGWEDRQEGEDHE